MGPPEEPLSPGLSPRFLTATTGGLAPHHGLHRDYVPVDVEHLELGRETGFDLYLKNPDGEYVLFLAGTRPFTQRELSHLETRVLRQLYVRRESRGAYLDAVAAEIGRTIQSGKGQPEERARFVYESASTLMEDLFEAPRAPAVARARSAIRECMAGALHDPELLHALLTLTSHDYYTYTHSINVCVFGTGLAREVIGADGAVLDLAEGLLLHDIGKIGIPEALLRKPGPLDDEEWKVMRCHPMRGVELIRDAKALSGTIETVTLQHHERHDGRGYPQGLPGREIHLYGRIAMIADVFDALTTNRAYRAALDTLHALRIMQEEMIENFDPDFFRAFVYLFRKKG